MFFNNDLSSVKIKCLQEREEQIKILHEKITEIQRCSQEQLEEKTSQLDEIVETRKTQWKKEKLKQQLKVKELELDEIRKTQVLYSISYWEITCGLIISCNQFSLIISFHISTLNQKWHDKGRLLCHLEMQVKEVKENFENKEENLGKR